MTDTNASQPNSRTLVVGIDGTEPGLNALKSAADLSSAMHAHLVVVYVRHIPAWWPMAASAGEPPEGLNQMFDEIEAQVRGQIDTVLHDHHDWELEVTDGDPVDRLLGMAEQHHASAVAVGSHGHRPLSPLILGSVAAGLVRRSPISVVIVRTPHPDPAPTAA
jgi:nucleotide-binding universal stress UspA family protein